MNEDKIQLELNLLRREISMIDMSAHFIEGWLPRKYVKKFFDISDTTLNTLEKSGKLIVSKIGRRKFYDIKSITELLQKNIYV